MKTKQYLSRYSAFILASSLLLTACAGQQAAQELAGLEISTLIEYKQAINKSIAAENDYYVEALGKVNKRLKSMNEDTGFDNALSYQAIYYDHLWHKSPPSQHDVLSLIDAVYTNYDKTNQELATHLKQLDEKYFSKIENIKLQQNNIDSSIAALSKLYAGDELKAQATLLKYYIANTAETVRKATETNK